MRRFFRVMIVTVAVCAAIFLMFQFPAVFSGDAISFHYDPLLGEHIVVHSISMDIVSTIAFLSGMILLCTMIRRRLSDRKKGPQKLIRGGKASQDE
jgi:hypothetical protein